MSLPWEYSKYGVPILSNPRIERIAYKVLMKYQSHTIKKPGKAPVMEILYYLTQKHHVNMNITDLGSRDGYKIRGRIHFQDNIICIDQEIFDEAGAIFLFTGAHEIGHWLLHRHRPIIERQQTSPIVELIDDDLTLKYTEDKGFDTSQEWIEHHANKFAAALLMPQNMMRISVEILQKEMGIHRNLGKIYLNPDEGSQTDFKRMLHELHVIFGTSITSLRYRLKNLGILITEIQ